MVKRHFSRIFLGLLSAVIVILLSILFPGIFRDWEAKTLDYRFQLRGNINTYPKIVLIDCDDPSMAKLGRWPWRREVHAGVIDKLKSYGAEVIAYDILFSYPVIKDTSRHSTHSKEEKNASTRLMHAKGEDFTLSQSTLLAENVIYPFGVELSTDPPAEDIIDTDGLEKYSISGVTDRAGYYFIANALFPFKGLLNNSAGLGHIASHRDYDGSIRRVPLIIRQKDRLFPAFSLAAIARYLKVAKGDIVITPGKEILFKNTVFPEDNGEKTLRIPINRKGEMLINYAGKWTETFQHISFIDIYENKYPEKEVKQLFKNSLSIISNSATGFDIKPVPVEKDFPGGGIHANIINTILTKQFIGYPSFSTKILILFFIGFLCAMFVYNRRWQYQLMVSFLIWTGYLLLAFFLFRSAGIVTEILRPTLTVFFSSLVFALWFGREKQARVETLTEEKENLEIELSRINENLDKKEGQIVAFNRQLKELTEKIKETESRQDSRIEELTRKLENELKAKNKLNEKKKELERKYKDLIANVPMKMGAPSPELETLVKECLEHGIVTTHPLLLELFQQLKKASETTISVLLLGESGTGKELFARAVHTLSPRSEKPFVVADLTTIPDTLVESELFGHVKGAFTGATSEKKGKFQLADGGTLFLDEIGEVKPELQIKLLRVLQEGELNRVGDTKQIKVDVRIIAATNRDLKQDMEEKKFRGDLFYRINGIAIKLPRLEERKEDIPLLAHHFVQKYNLEYKKNISGISELATEFLKENQWPGHIRELENLIQRSVTLSDTDIIQLKDLGITLADKDMESNGGRNRKNAKEGLPFEKGEDESFLNLLRENNFSIDRVKKILNVERGTVSGRFKGICFQVLQKYNGDIQKTAKEIAANNGLVSDVESRIKEYRNNLLEKIKSYSSQEQAIAEILKKEKNTKKRYLSYIEDFIRNRFE